MKVITKNTILFIILILIISCDNNDNNNTSIPCDANFYTLTSDSNAILNDFQILKYQKSTNFNSPNTIGNIEGLQGSPQMMFNNVTSDNSIGEVSYFFPGTSELITLDVANNSVNKETLTTFGRYPEYIDGELHFLKFSSSTVDVIDKSGNIISSNLNLDLSGSGLFDLNAMSTTSDQNSGKIFYLANNVLFVYDKPNNTLSKITLETYNNSNPVKYSGIEFISANELLMMKGSTVSGQKNLELIKLNISDFSNPIMTSVMSSTDFSSALSFNVGRIIGRFEETVCTSYDDCDNSYYVSFFSPDVFPSQAYIIECKLNSNVINEYSLPSGKYILGVEHD